MYAVIGKKNILLQLNVKSIQAPEFKRKVTDI